MISIIIPAYNEEKYLEKTLKSIHEQTTDDHEIIVVANGCTDNTEKIAQRYADRTFSINKPNVSLARNIGASHAKGDILLFLDADTQLARNAVTEIQNQFSKKDAIATLLVYPQPNKLQYRILLTSKNFLHTSKLFAGSGGTIITSKSLFDHTGGFNKKLTIKENRVLIKQLKRLGNYKVIRRTYALTSTRRLDRWGLLGTSLFWLRNRWGNRENVSYELVR